MRVMLLFLKAYQPGLFDQQVTVSGHATKKGTYVQPQEAQEAQEAEQGAPDRPAHRTPKGPRPWLTLSPPNRS